MIESDRLTAFINSMDRGNTKWLDCVEQDAIAGAVPIIRKDTQSLLKFLLKLEKSVQILEVGTATGFSALLMAEYSRPDAKITTIEKYDKRIPVARANFQKYDTAGKISLIEGDASDILKTMEPGYDFIFMDAAKGQYINFLPDIFRILVPGGLLVSDNVLQDGDIVESRFAVERRNRTIYSRMREYLFTLKHDSRLETAILPVGDGMALSVRL